MTRHDFAVVFLVTITLGLGIAIDGFGPNGSWIAVSLWTWGLLAWVFHRATKRHRAELVVAVFIGILGEFVLGSWLGLYEYASAVVPPFVPAGHALVFSAGRRLAPHVPSWTGVALGVTAVAYVAVTALVTRSFVVLAVTWMAMVVVVLLISGREHLSLFPILSAFAVAIEMWGTHANSWTYSVSDPLSAVTGISAPLWVIGPYCLLAAFALVAGDLFATDVSSDEISKAD